MLTLTQARAALELPKTLPGLAIGSQWEAGQGDSFARTSPLDGAPLVDFQAASEAQVARACASAKAAFAMWREVPAPKRGTLVRLMGEGFRRHQDAIATLITEEAGKIPAEAAGEAQEIMDICDFAVGLSRQLHGLTIASERPQHRLDERWHPLGPIGCLTAFNFPAAVWGWNAALAIVCGDPVVWKPSEKTSLTALACHRIACEAAQACGAPEGLFALVLGGAKTGRALVDDLRLPLISATGSEAMGKAVGVACAGRFARTLLELGGNNGLIVCPSADLNLASRAIVFAAVGTAGQRCTSLRRLIVHESVRAPLLDAVKKAYASLKVGDPRQAGVLVGPLIDARAVQAHMAALAEARAAGAQVFGGEPLGGNWVAPAIMEGLPPDHPLVQRETFAPILYVLPYGGEVDEAIALHNAVPQGLSSAIFTRDLREAGRFCGPAGSDCGLANVNAGTSGAEIGGAFGGEKTTGGGRESGSDAWKAYMRRSTQTINEGSALPLAQGVVFDA